MFFGVLFAFWRFMEIITLIPTLGMLSYFVHAYITDNRLTPDYIVILFIVSVLGAVWALATLFTYHRTKTNALFVSFIDLLFIGAFIGAVYALRFIGHANCTTSSKGSTGTVSAGDASISVTGIHFNTNKECAMLKASWAFGIMNCIFFAITSLLALFVGRRREERVVVKESHYSRHGHRRSGSHRSHRSSHSGRRSHTYV